VTVWDKGLAARSGATVGGAALAAAGAWRVPDDEIDVHFRDTIRGGSYLNNQRLARIVCEEAPARAAELEQWGLQFDREPDGRYVLDIAGGHSYPRLLAVSDRVGLQIAKVLTKLVVEVKTELASVEETLRRLQHIRPDVKVVLSTGYHESEATRRFLGKGLAGFIQKPYTAAQLGERIKTVIGTPPGPAV
jgi:succinate dehydrogenase/fumarate reductase flavoprotein subunit